MPSSAERPSWAPSGRQRPILLALVAYAVLFALVMTGGAKKFDRYLLPVFPALDIVAAWGLATALGGWGGRGRRAGRAGGGDADDARAPAVAALAAVRAEAAVAFGALGVAWVLALTLRAHRPYYLDAYNPLAGGARAAEFALLLGWGEGLDQAAAWLNDHPDAADGEVAMRYRSAVGPLIAGHALEMNKIDVATVDHYLFYRNQLQRRLDPDLIARYFGPEAPTDRAPTPVIAPDLTVTLGGLAYGWLFANRNWEPAAHFIDDRADPARDAILVRAGAGFARGYTGPLPVVEVDPDAADEAVDALLADAFGAHERLWWVRYDDLVPYPGLQHVDDALATRAVRTAEAAFDEVRVARFDRPAGGAGAVAGGGGDGEAVGATAGVTATGIATATAGVAALTPVTATAVLTAPIAYFDRDAPAPAPAVALVGVAVPGGAAEPGRGVPIVLRWSRTVSDTSDLVGFLHLVPADDVGQAGARRLAQDDRPLRDDAGRPTSQWAPGAVQADRRVVAIPAGTVPGRYALLVGVYDGGTGRRLDAAPRPADDPTSLGSPGALKDAQRLADGVFAVPIDVGRSPAAFDDSALGLSHGHLDAALTDGVALWGFDVARPVEAGGAAAVTAVWSVPGGAGAATAATSATVGASTSTGAATASPAFVHIRITDTLGANVSDVTAPIVALPVDAWRPGDRLRADYLAPIYGRALAGEGFIRFSLLDADGRPLPGRGPDGRAAIVAPFTIDGPLRTYILSPDLPSGAHRTNTLPADVPARARRDVVFGDITDHDAPLGGLARLRAAEIAAARVDAGAPVTVTLWWEALAQADADLLVMVGFRSAEGDIVDAGAFAPADGRRPLTSWITGEVIRDRRILVADVAPGRYDVVVRLTAADGGDAPVAATGAGVSAGGADGGDGWVAVGRVTVR